VETSLHPTRIVYVCQLLKGCRQHNSLGLIALELAANVILPHNGPEWQKLRRGDISRCPFVSISQALVDLISHMITPEPSKRPTASDVLEHPILKNIMENRTGGALVPEDDTIMGLIPEVTQKSSRRGRTNTRKMP
jgi:serine/threonine protein kinase